MVFKEDYDDVAAERNKLKRELAEYREKLEREMAECEEKMTAKREKIEFEAVVETVYKAHSDEYGSHLVVFNCIGVPGSAKVGYKYRVILEPVDQEADDEQ